VTFTTPGPEDLQDIDPKCNYLEITLSATDSDGNTQTVSQDLKPHAVDLTFQSLPTGARLVVNGAAFTTPLPIVSWEGYKLDVSAPDSQTLSGSTYAFDSWSDGGARPHPIVTSAEPTTYTATYVACTVTGTSGNDVLQGTSGDDVICGLGGNDTLRGLGGNDILKGGDGLDTLLGGTGGDTLDGGGGTDTASYSGSATAVVASLATGTATGEGSDSFKAVENLTGSPLNDALTGSSGTNTLSGGGGADTLRGARATTQW
jgi:Ca2+-binding RTX toxin-like protein